jgi:hypothetical protein
MTRYRGLDLCSAAQRKKGDLTGQGVENMKRRASLSDMLSTSGETRPSEIADLRNCPSPIGGPYGAFFESRKIGGMSF